MNKKIINAERLLPVTNRSVNLDSETRAQLKSSLKIMIEMAQEFLYHDPDIGPTIVAGFDHFAPGEMLTNWGRDTGMTLFSATALLGNSQMFQDISETYLSYIKGGLEPNFIGNGQNPDYNSIDATGCFGEALALFLEQTGNFDFFLDNRIYMKNKLSNGKSKATIFEILEDVIAMHQKEGGIPVFCNGGYTNIYINSRGLVAGGNEMTNLSWQDAKEWGEGKIPYTPRWGAQVGVNARHIVTLSLAAKVSAYKGDMQKARYYNNLAKQARAAFNQDFWFKPGQYLRDVAWGNHYEEYLFRPNQFVALAWNLLDDINAKGNPIVDRAIHDLLTPYGLRTRSPFFWNGGWDPAFRPERHEGNRNEAYHQGIVWPWLLGYFMLSSIRVKGQQETVNILEKAHVFKGLYKETQLGLAPEIYNAWAGINPDKSFNPFDGFNGTGCYKQSWTLLLLLGLSRLVPELFQEALEEVKNAPPWWAFTHKIYYAPKGKEVEVKIKYPEKGNQQVKLHYGTADPNNPEGPWTDYGDIIFTRIDHNGERIPGEGVMRQANLPADANVFGFKFPNGEWKGPFVIRRR
ncbi:amylo-alpha-1,6-glucosidase [Candidatus Margulisiibacteriota bacterium]